MFGDNQKAWMFFSISDDAGWGGNDGYRDVISRYYRYDQYVPSHKRVTVGDVALIRDRAAVIGLAKIESIKSWMGVKTFKRCPTCMKTKINPRTTVEPTYRCDKCGAEFNEPVPEERECEIFQAEYGGSFVALDKPLPDDSAYAHNGRQHSIRELNIRATKVMLESWNVYFTGTGPADGGFFPDDEERALEPDAREDGVTISGVRDLTEGHSKDPDTGVPSATGAVVTGHRKYWMLLSVPDDAQWGGNNGYQDDISTTYRYDQFVNNSRKLGVGDIVFVRTRGSIVGMGHIERIDCTRGIHTFNRCPECGTSGIKPRKTVTPLYRCHSCKHEFQTPEVEGRPADCYAAIYQRSFIAVDLPLPDESAYIGKAKQNSIRQICTPDAEGIIRSAGLGPEGLEETGVLFEAGARNVPDPDPGRSSVVGQEHTRGRSDGAGDSPDRHTSMIERPQPEEIELHNKLQELETLADELANRECALETLHMRVDSIFRSAWFELGPVLTRLRKLRSDIAESLDSLVGTDESFDRSCYAARTLDRTPGPHDLFDSMKRLAGQLPLVAEDTKKQWFVDIVKLTNTALSASDDGYDEGSLGQRRSLLMDRARKWFHGVGSDSPADILDDCEAELTDGDQSPIADRLVAAIRLIASAGDRIATIEVDTKRLQETIEYRLMTMFLESGSVIDEDRKPLPRFISRCSQEFDSEVADLESGIADVSEQLILLYGER